MWLLVRVALLAMVFSSGAKAQVVREEIYSFQSETLPDADFLNGKSGAPVNIAGALRLPRVGSDKLPAVILLHGSGGIQGYGAPPEEWSRELNSVGIATFLVDSFASRGIVETVTDQSRLGRLNMIVDAYRTLQLLAAHRQIEPNRIARVADFPCGAAQALFGSYSIRTEQIISHKTQRFLSIGSRERQYGYRSQGTCLGECHTGTGSTHTTSWAHLRPSLFRVT
jgi:hypothetical protein